MTPQEFEWRQERLEDAYRKRRIGKITLLREMRKLGFRNVDQLREWLKELDNERAPDS